MNDRKGREKKRLERKCCSSPFGWPSARVLECGLAGVMIHKVPHPLGRVPHLPALGKWVFLHNTDDTRRMTMRKADKQPSRAALEAGGGGCSPLCPWILPLRSSVLVIDKVHPGILIHALLCKERRPTRRHEKRSLLDRRGIRPHPIPQAEAPRGRCPRSAVPSAGRGSGW